MAPLFDHLWQSILVLVLIGLSSLMARSHAAVVRLWMWRVAALKFLLPFSLLYALGGWLGFPVRHSALPPPAILSEGAAALMPWAAPAQTLPMGSRLLTGGLLLLSAASALGLGWIARQLLTTREQVRRERAVAQGSPPPHPGFLTATMLASLTLGVLSLPLLGGALHDRATRQQALAVDLARLRSAAIEMRETPTRFGARTDIVTRTDGILIRYINLKDLVALVYGIGQFEVFGGALPWLEEPHYDVLVSGPLSAPAVFDPYSLHQPVTDYLSREYGVSIRVNGNCQEPCLNQESFVVERLPWTLMKMIRERK